MSDILRKESSDLLKRVRSRLVNLSGASLMCLCVVMAGITGCVSAVERDLVQLENSVDDFRALYAEQSTLIEQLDAKVKSLQGRIEELEYAQKRTLGDEVSSLRNALSTLKKRVPPPGIVPEAALDSAEASAKGLPSEISSLVSSALAHVREGSFSKAIPLLEGALEKGEAQNFSAEIMFWLGVCYDGLGDNRKALLAYHRIISLDSDSPLAPAALSRQADVFERMGDNKSRVVTLRKLVSSDPRSPVAKEARKLLTRVSE